MKFEKQILEKIKSKKIWSLIFFAIGLLALALQSKKTNSSLSAAAVEEKVESVDTYIPKGFVLVPLNLANTDSLNSFIGDKGIVDLYTAQDGKRSKKIANRIKVIRAPLNPDMYAALVSENQSEKLVLDGESYYAVVQNKNSNVGKVDSFETPKNDFKIYYQKENKK